MRLLSESLRQPGQSSSLYPGKKNKMAKEPGVLKNITQWVQTALIPMDSSILFSFFTCCSCTESTIGKCGWMSHLFSIQTCCLLLTGDSMLDEERAAPFGLSLCLSLFWAEDSWWQAFPQTLSCQNQAEPFNYCWSSSSEVQLCHLLPQLMEEVRGWGEAGCE